MTRVTFVDTAGLGYVDPVHMLAGLNEIASTSATAVVFASSFDTATTLRATGTGITVDGSGHITGGTITGIEFLSGGLVEASLTGFAPFAAVDAGVAFTSGSLTGYQQVVDLLVGRTVVTGSAASDWMDVGSGNDVVTGGAGDDHVSKFQAGDLRFDGGDGLDTLNLGAANGVVYPTPYVQTFVVDLGAGTAISPYGGTFTLISVENVIGTAAADIITGSDGANVIGDGYFDRGADTIQALGGDDMVKVNGQEVGIVADGGTGVDTLYVSTFGGPQGVHVFDLENAARDTGFFLHSQFTGFENLSLSADTTLMRLHFYGDAGANRVESGAGDDLLYGRGGTDVLFGGDGNDTINGGLGADFQIGGAGDDVYVVNNAGDTMQEAADQGHDLVLASVSTTLWANVEDLTLTGTAVAGQGNDLANVLRGTAGDNVLTGGGGVDSLYGGLGADRFVWLAVGDSGVGVGARDVVEDFATGDRIDLGGMDANVLKAGVQHFRLDTGGGFHAGEYRVAAAGDHVVVSLNVDGAVDAQIEILGVTSLSAGDFLL